MKTLVEQFLEEETSGQEEVLAFSKRLVYGVEEHLAQIDQYIMKYSTNWEFHRMAIIDRNILRLGIFELFFTPDVPPKVSINEAVELAKKYGDIESSKFVNGILDQIHKKEILGSSPPVDTGPS